MGDCCKIGFRWSGQPKGTETKLGSNPVYVTGSNSERAILFIADVYGWKFNNSRVLADQLAEETKSTVYVPDYFGGEVIPEDALSGGKFDLMAFLGRNSKDIRYPEIEANAKELKSKHKKLTAVGYCWGAWGSFQLAAKGNDYLDAVAVAHPSLLEKKDMDNLAKPTLIIAPENDPMLTAELKEYANTVIPKIGIPYQYDYYPGLTHGFAVKGDQNDPKQSDGLNRAKDSVVNWFVQFTH